MGGCGKLPLSALVVVMVMVMITSMAGGTEYCV